jgi:hypothetical protein
MFKVGGQMGRWVGEKAWMLMRRELTRVLKGTGSCVAAQRTIRTPTALPKFKSSLDCWLSVDSLRCSYTAGFAPPVTRKTGRCPNGRGKLRETSLMMVVLLLKLTHWGAAGLAFTGRDGFRNRSQSRCFPLRNTLRQIRMANRIWCLRR